MVIGTIVGLFDLDGEHLQFVGSLLTTVAGGHGQCMGIDTFVGMCDLDGEHLQFVGNLAHNCRKGPWAINAW